MGARSVLLIGGHDAGKSNYLFKLWLALERAKGTLAKRGLPTDIEYVRTGADELLHGKFAGHTPGEVFDRTEIPVAGRQGDSAGTIVVPDVAGEKVLSIYRTRTWSSKWEDMIDGNTGCLLFVRPDSTELVVNLDWITWFNLIGGPVEGNAVEIPDGEIRTPTQVVLVDWLQFLRKAFTERVGGTFRPRVGIVVTAWDAIPTDQQDLGAEVWIHSNLPLLHQFTISNDDLFDFSFFGLSVTGGDLKADNEFRTQYLDGDPASCGYVVRSASGSIQRLPDITLPVAWALGLTS